jgi:hypothetical protein
MQLVSFLYASFERDAFMALSLKTEQAKKSEILSVGISTGTFGLDEKAAKALNLVFDILGEFEFY